MKSTKTHGNLHIVQVVCTIVNPTNMSKNRKTFRRCQQDMTSNQIAYWNLVEQQRTHKANEAIASEQAKHAGTQAAAAKSRAETAKQEAAIKSDTLKEQTRHNKAQETISIADTAVKGASSILNPIGRLLGL